MKKNHSFIALLIAILGLFIPAMGKAQEKSKILADAQTAKAAFITADPGLANLFNSSYGYVIFPHIGKGAIIIGGGHGNGAVYEGGNAIGMAKITQLTVGAQIGGQAFREVIFFENKDALDRFKQNKFEFSAQASATAAKSGASANAQYRDGVQVFTEEINGLMVEASIGGQKFKYKSF